MLGIAVVCDFRRDSERSADAWQGANPPTILNIPGAQTRNSGGAGRGARPYLESMFQAIDKEFGSFDEYRRKALGISDADLAALKAKLLE